jgi:hypothetical protein
MHCDNILPLVEKLADGECTEPERARVEAHLAECESCQEHFRFVQALPEAARKVPLPEPPGAYWDVLPRKVMARIEKEQSTKGRGWLSQILAVPRLRWLGAIAAGVIAVVLSYEVLTLEQERKPATVTEPAEEPVLEEKVPSEPSKTAPDVVAGEAVKRADQDRPDVGGALRRKRPSPTPAEGGGPTPARLPEASPSGKARALQESRDEADVSASPEPISKAAGAAGRGRTIAEAEEAPVAVMAEDVTKPEEARAPPVAQPAAPKLKAAEPLSVEPTKAELEAREADQPQDYRVRKQASLERKGVSPVVFSEKDRETTSVRGPELETKCGALRDSIDPSAEVGKREDIGYQLALCSIELYQLRQTEEDRSQGEKDASAYLDFFPEGEHADEIREFLEQISKQ